MAKDVARKGGGRKQIGGRNQRGSGKQIGLKTGSGGLVTSLLKSIGVSEEQRRRASASDEEGTEKVEGDVYEYEEGVPEEERGKNRRFDDTDRLEYELPSDFEDEEIDEEAVFGGGEEEEKENAVPRNGAKKRVKEADLNSDQDTGEEDEDEDEEEEEDDVEGEEEGQAEDKSSGGFLSGDEEDGEEEEEEEEEESDDADEGKHRQMIEAVTGKTANGKPDREGRRGKAPVLSEAYPESEFNLNSSTVTGNSGITVEDLMTPLQDKTGFGTVRKRMEQLKKKGAPLESPLPRVFQDRLNRKVAYQKTSEDVTKWQPIVKANREAPTLVFNKPEPAPSLSLASLAASFRPTTNLAKEVDALLRESKLLEVKDIEAAEALELNKLTVEEVRERQERLGKMRNLLFRHEVKAKRLKKIKSKAFHRLRLKDQKSKAGVEERDPEAAKAAAIKQEFNRAQERMTLKHKNSTRWAKRILKRGFKASENDGTKEAIADQLRTHAALTRKINSATLSDSDGASSDSEEEKDSVSGLVLEENGRTKVLAKARVETLKALEDGNEEDSPTKGLFSLPFMARAIEKKKKAAQNEALAILEQLEEAEHEGDAVGLDEDFTGSRNRNGDKATPSGRVSFGTAKSPNQTNGNGAGPRGVSTSDDGFTHSTWSDDESDDKPEAKVLDASMSQQDLVAQAFAEDDVEAEFEKVKSQVLDEEVPIEEGPVSLPGWGQWTHVQKKRGQPAWLLKEQEQLKSKRENALSKRKDAHLKHVILSEKLDKKATKFSTPSVPFPFTSREVYERSTRQPIGRDFNTDKAFRDMIRPAVIKSAGVIIDPITLDKSSVKRQRTTVAAAQVAKRTRKSLKLQKGTIGA